MQPRMIVIDGKTYYGLDDMPPDIRQKYEQALKTLGDANNNGLPDGFERFNVFADKDRNGAPEILEDVVAGQAAVNSMKIVIDGKVFHGSENLPPDVRLRYEEAMAQLDANRNGIPDFLEGLTGRYVEVPRTAAGSAPDRVRQNPLSRVRPVATPETTTGWPLVLAGLFIFFFCAVALGGMWYFFLR